MRDRRRRKDPEERSSIAGDRCSPPRRSKGLASIVAQAQIASLPIPGLLGSVSASFSVDRFVGREKLGIAPANTAGTNTLAAKILTNAYGGPGISS